MYKQTLPYVYHVSLITSFQLYIHVTVHRNRFLFK